MSHAYLKSTFRSIRNNFLLFGSITLIIAVGVAFVTGVAGISPKLTDSLSEDFESLNVADLTLKSKASSGFTSTQIESLDDYLSKSGEEYETMEVFTVDLCLNEDGGETRIYIYPSPENQNLNTLEIIEGTWPTAADEVAVQLPLDSDETEYEVGGVISIEPKENPTENESLSYATYTSLGLPSELKVTAIVRNPTRFYRGGEYSNFSGYVDAESGDLISAVALNRTFYFSKDAGFYSLYPNTDIYLKSDSINDRYFGGVYIEECEKMANQIQGLDGFGEDEVSILDNLDCMSYAILDNLVEKINVLAWLFPAFFIFIVALVVLTSMSKLVDDERSLIGCFESLGFSRAKITSKYVVFALISGVLGSLIGVFSGAYTLPLIIYPAFDGTFLMPTMTSKISLTLGLLSSLLIVMASIAVTAFVCYKRLNSSPASLLLPKSPKPGKTTIIERIKPIWKLCSFKWKSTLRNVFRYPWRFLMVIVSVAGSTALVFAGLALGDISGEVSFLGGDPIDMTKSLEPISWAVVIFAMALAILVIFNLANMNIGERKREIATLEVLGYFGYEVVGYIFREILIMCFVGIILGIPAGILLVYWIFNALAFGDFSQIAWSSYVGSAGIAFAFVIIVAVLLIPKIKIIDMNDSLKSVE